MTAKAMGLVLNYLTFFCPETCLLPTAARGGMTRTHKRMCFVQRSYFVGLSTKNIPIEPFSYTYFSSAIKPVQPQWFGFNVHSLLKELSLDE